MAIVTMTVNGQSVGPHEVADAMAMVDYLNDVLGLTGTKFSCGIGVCHACVVIVDEPDGTRTPMRTCINGAATFSGKSIRTVEGHAQDGNVSAVQQAFLDHFAFQCGYCTSGFVNAATALVDDLRDNPIAKADVEERVLSALGEHVCRCTGYIRYYEATRDLILSDPGLTREA